MDYVHILKILRYYYEDILTTLRGILSMTIIIYYALTNNSIAVLFIPLCPRINDGVQQLCSWRRIFREYVQ